MRSACDVAQVDSEIQLLPNMLQHFFDNSLLQFFKFLLAFKKREDKNRSFHRALKKSKNTHVQCQKQFIF